MRRQSLKNFDYFLKTSRHLEPIVKEQKIPTFKIENTIGLEHEKISLVVNVLKGKYSII